MFIGTCGFKGSPDAHGAVEIAYFTFPDNERRGYATEMARALIDIARRSGVVRKVVAHTHVERGASVRVLEKTGMQRCGAATDSEQGVAWRWELELPT